MQTRKKPIPLIALSITMPSPVGIENGQNYITIEQLAKFHNHVSPELIAMVD